MGTASVRLPRCVVIAGPNGSGKTTFAHEFLPRDAGIMHFVNADAIAAGMSPFRPSLVALSAGRVGTMCRPATCSGVSIVVG